MNTNIQYIEEIMNREQQDYVWSKCLPKEYREEVKKEYHQCLNDSWYVSSYLRGRLRMLRELFGEHNLTSDAEPEDVTRAKPDVPSSDPKLTEQKIAMKPIESKVSVYLATAEEDEEFRSLLHENGFKWSAGDSLKDHSYWSEKHKCHNTHCLYPRKTVTYSGAKTPGTLTFSEFKKQYFEAELEETTVRKNLSDSTPLTDKEVINHFDTILKDGFRNERRLNIAAQILSGIVASSKPYRHPVKRALELADALIAESQKGGKSWS